jgi:hypothetical protein
MSGTGRAIHTCMYISLKTAQFRAVLDLTGRIQNNGTRDLDFTTTFATYVNLDLRAERQYGTDLRPLCQLYCRNLTFGAGDAEEESIKIRWQMQTSKGQQVCEDQKRKGFRWAHNYLL